LWKSPGQGWWWLVFTVEDWTLSSCYLKLLVVLKIGNRTNEENLLWFGYEVSPQKVHVLKDGSPTGGTIKR
jgi:hypothetical protein